MNAKRGRWLEFPSSIGLGVIAIALLHAWSARSRYLYEADSLGFAFGMHEYAVQKDQPHAPGYPLWILCARALDRVFLDANTALTALAFGFAALAGLVFLNLAQRRVSGPGAVVLTTLFVVSPGFLFHACTPTTYAVDLFASSALGALAAHAWQGSFRHALLGVVFAAVLAGFRQSSAILMLPLVFAAVVRASTAPRHYAYAAAAGLGPTLIWYVPTALLQGGPREFQRMTARRVLEFLGDTSVLFGAPARVHWEMALSNAIWLGLLALPCAMLWVLARMKSARRDWIPRSSVPRPFSDWRFVALWMAPNLLYVFLIHAPKPGYLCLSLPPLVLLVGGAAIDLLEADRRWLRSEIDSGTAWLFKPIAAVLLSLAIWQQPWSQSPDALAIDANNAPYRLSLRAIRDADDATAALLGLLKGSDPREELIVADDPRFGGLSQRKIAFYLPNHTVLFVYPDQPGFHEQRGFETRPFGAIPSGVRRLWWVGPAGESGPRAGPLDRVSRVAYRGSWLCVFVTDLGDAPLSIRVRRGRVSGDLRREVAPKLQAGFFPLENSADGQFVWTSGPLSTVLIPQAFPGKVNVAMNAHALRSGQRMVILANGRQIGAIDNPQSSSPVRVTFYADAGWNRLELAFDSWNGMPDVFAPNDERPLGVMIRQLSIETGDGFYELVSERAEPPEIPLLHPGSIVDVGTEKRAGLLASGWANHSNGSLRPTIAQDVEVRFRLPDRRPLEIEVSGFASEPLAVVLVLNGREVTTLPFTPALSMSRATLPADQIAPENQLVLRLPDAHSQIVVQTIRIAANGS